MRNKRVVLPADKQGRKHCLEDVLQPPGPPELRACRSQSFRLPLRHPSKPRSKMEVGKP
jgi:hypothetical protein